MALLLSAYGDLVGDPDAIEPLLTSSAVPRTSGETCGGVPGSEIPNNTYGWGRADALAAVTIASSDLQITQTDAPDPTLVGVSVSYTLTITNLGPGTAAAVTVTQGLTLSASIDSATPSQGTCTLLAHGASCNLGSIASGGTATVVVVGTPSVLGTLTSNATVATTGLDPQAANNAASVQTTVDECPFDAPMLGTAPSVPAETSGLTASTSSGAGHELEWSLTGGVITGGQGSPTLTFQSGAAGTTMLLELLDTLGSCEVAAEPVTIAVDFTDVPFDHIFREFVNAVLRSGITGGCGGGNFCPGQGVTRGQMAVFLLKAKNGAGHTPPDCTGTVFADVPCTGGAFDPWIEELASLGITGGCGGGNFCPDATVTRAQMAVFLLKAKEGSAYEPPAAAGVFGDVPVDNPFAPWVEELYARDITGGCNVTPLLYCPGNPNNRGQMAVFLVKTFDLQ